MKAAQLRYYFLNVICLTIGIVSATLLFRWVLHELSYDNFIQDSGRIYRLVSENDLTGKKYAAGVCRLREDLPLAVPQVEECVAVIPDGYSGFSDVTVRNPEGGDPIEAVTLNVNDNFFNAFTYPIVEGEPRHILGPNEVAISSSLAKKLFDGSAFGKTLISSYFGEETIHNIALVVDVPANTHLPFDVVMPMSSFSLNLYRTIKESHPIYVKLKENATFSKKDLKSIVNFQMDHYEVPAKLSLQPVRDIHLHTPFADSYSVGNKSSADVWIVITGIVLLIAVTIANCATLDVSYSVRQTKNRAVRRIFGCEENRILFGIIAETGIVTLVSIAISILMVYLLQPVFETWIGSPLQKGFDLKIIAFYLSLLVLLPLMSVLFGRYCLHGVAFSDILKSKMRYRKGIGISNASSMIQVGISSFMAVFTIVITIQLAYMHNADKGIDLSDIVSFNSCSYKGYQEGAIRDELTKNPDILSVGVCSGDMTHPLGVTNEVEWDGKAEGEDVVFQALTTDGYFMEMTGMRLIAGRFLDKNLNVDDYFDAKYDNNREYVINKSAATAMGLNPAEAIGKKLTVGYWNQGQGVIVGVVEDFRFLDMRNAVGPLIMCYYPENLPNLMVKISHDNRQHTMNYIQSTIGSFAYSDVFSYSFLEEKELYSKEKQVSHISLLYLLAAMMLASFGFFGVISYHLSQEDVNMAIRKVHGATNSDVIWHYLKTKLGIYFLPVIVAVVVSSSLSFRWLQQFAYHISSLSVVAVGLTTIVTVVVALALITAGVVWGVCRKKITDVLNK